MLCTRSRSCEPSSKIGKAEAGVGAYDAYHVRNFHLLSAFRNVRFPPIADIRSPCEDAGVRGAVGSS